jgi:hypothetical protein
VLAAGDRSFHGAVASLCIEGLAGEEQGPVDRTREPGRRFRPADDRVAVRAARERICRPVVQVARTHMPLEPARREVEATCERLDRVFFDLPRR